MYLLSKKRDITKVQVVKQKTAITLIGGGVFYLLIGQGVVDYVLSTQIQWDGGVGLVVIIIGVVGLVRRGKDNYNERRDP